MSPHREGRLPHGAALRALVYACLIAVSIVLWWALIKLAADISAGL